MGLILDSCIFIHAERKGSTVNFNQWQAYQGTYISAVTASELLVGVAKADTAAKRLKRSAFVEAIIAKIPTLDFTIKVARIHAELYSYLSKNSQLIGAHDLIIAATAVTYGHALLTMNIQEFSRIPGLTLLTP